MDNTLPRPRFRVAVPSNPNLPAGLVVALILCSVAAQAADWPQFRGPQGDGIAPAAGLARSWGDGGPPELWRRPMGEGFSALTIAGDQLYTLFAEGGDEFVASFRVADGSEVWRRQAGKKFIDHWGNGPRATPAVDGDTVFALASNGALYALRTTDGQPIWEIDLEARFGSPNRPASADEGSMAQQGLMPYWGFCSSPLIEGDLLIVYTGAGKGNSLVAFDKTTGEVRWARMDHRSSYSSPFAVTIGGQRQIVVAMAEEIVSLTPAGEVIWRHPWARYGVAQPVFMPPDKLFFSSANDIGALLLALRDTAEGTAVEEVWREPRMRNNWQSSIAHGGAIVGFDNATLKVLSAGGEVLWGKRGLGKGTLALADDLLFVLGDKGVLTIAEWNLESFHQLSRQTVLNGTTLTAPSVAQGKLFLRGQEEMVCFDLEPRPAGAAGSEGTR